MTNEPTINNATIVKVPNPPKPAGKTQIQLMREGDDCLPIKDKFYWAAEYEKYQQQWRSMQMSQVSSDIEQRIKDKIAYENALIRMGLAEAELRKLIEREAAEAKAPNENDLITNKGE